MRRPLATASVLAACIVFAMPGATPAFGQVPESSASVGQPFSYTGLVYSHLSPGYPQLLVDPDHDKCGGLSAGVHWGDFGALTPVPYPAQSSLVSVPGGWNVVVSASYTYKAPKNSGGASVDIEITCDGQLQKEIFLPWVTVTVTGASGGGSPPPESCPLPASASGGGPRINAFSAAAAGSSGGPVAWSAQQQECPPPKQKFKPTTKKKLQGVGATAALTATAAGITSTLLTASTLVEGVVPGTQVLVPVTTVGSRVFQIVAWGASAVGGLTALALYVDPPDSHYQSVAKPRKPGVTRVTPGGPLTKSRAAHVNQYLGGLARSGSLHGALLSAIERAQGAVLGHSPRRERVQMLAAARYAAALAKQLNRMPALSKGAAKALKQAGLRLKIPKKAAAAAKKYIVGNGFPPKATRGLAQLGPYAQRTREYLLEAIARTPASQLTTRLPQALASVRVLRAYRNEASAWGSFAKYTKANPLADY
jgi:hypothetical protein